MLDSNNANNNDDDSNRSDDNDHHNDYEMSSLKWAACNDLSTKRKNLNTRAHCLREVQI